MNLPRRRPAVLIVDDDFDVRELMEELIHDDGFEVLSARDGREALSQLRSHSICVVLLDLNMPTMDGKTFRTEQLADPALAPIPVVLVSGLQSSEACALELGLSHVVKKPFLPDDLLDALRRYR